MACVRLVADLSWASLRPGLQNHGWPAGAEGEPGRHQPAGQRLAVLAGPGPVARSQDKVGNLAQARTRSTGIGGKQRQVLAAQALRLRAGSGRKIDPAQGGELPPEPCVGDDLETKQHGARGQVSRDEIDAGDIAFAVESDVLPFRVRNAPRAASPGVEEQRRARLL